MSTTESRLQLTEPLSGCADRRTLRSMNPATGEEVGAIPMTSVEELPMFLHRARAAQRSWGAFTLEQRRDALRGAATRLKERAKDLGRLACLEMGKPIAEAVGEASYAASSLVGELDECVAALSPEVREDARTRSTLVFDPLGVAAAITPWNFPILMPQDCVIPALMAGNAVLLKPSEETTLVALEWAKAISEDLPADALQVVVGDEEQGKALVASPVDLIAFVGSRAAGKHILEAAGRGLKRVILELGGKDPLVILPDADLEAAAGFATRNCFRNAGQVCVSTERILVPEERADEFERLLVEKARGLKQGDPLAEGVNLGPMVNAGQKRHVLRQVESAIAEGARLLLGGESGEGNFMPPTVLSGVKPSMAIMRDETFGPVAAVVRYRTVDEAVAIANDSPYALGGAVFGRDEDRAEEVARRLHSGMVGVNRGCGGAEGTPWVGAKESGFGYHSGKEGHRQFAQVRVISRAKGGE
jgi:succinate-semialdehyde dehydrogenase/glutarate-semialdehyde dehydrogenase